MKVNFCLLLPASTWISEDLQSFSDVGWNQRIEAKLLDWDTKLGQLALVGLHHIGMGLSNLLELGLDFPNGLVLKLLDFLECAANHA